MKNTLAGKIRKLAKKISKLEGKKSQVKYGDVLEVLRVISVLEAKHYLAGGPYLSSPTAVIGAHTAYTMGKIILEKGGRKIRILKKKKVVRRKK